MRNFLLFTFFIFGFGHLQSQSIRIGLMADCQYCNCDYNAKWNNDYQKGKPRLQEAVNTFNSEKVNFALHLGDFIDRDFNSFNEVSPIFEQLQMPHYHVLGNHDFSVSDNKKSLVQKTLKLDQPYYTFILQNWKFIILDGTDISLYKWTDSTKINEVEQIRKQFLNQGRLQAMPWNGAISNTQLTWLEHHLALADSTKQNVLIFCHFPVLPESNANLWNDVELVTLIESHPSVKAFINGHHHPGNYELHQDVHYLTLQGMVRSTTQNAFSILTLTGEEIKIQGFGREQNRTLLIR